MANVLGDTAAETNGLQTDGFENLPWLEALVHRITVGVVATSLIQAVATPTEVSESLVDRR